MICFESSPDTEIKFISETLCNNDFPLNVVQTVITNKKTEFYEIKQESVQKCTVYLLLLCLSGISERFGKQISQTTEVLFFNQCTRGL